MRCRSTADRGGVTAETAAALPSLVLVLGIALAAIQAGAVHVACVDAARVGARVLSRGEPEHAVRAAVADTAPGSADVRVHEHGGMARVTVTAPVPLGPLIDLPVEARGRAATPVEEREGANGALFVGAPGREQAKGAQGGGRDADAE
ncbi:TadE family type IV pilus minor pilin [Streptomonospora algeriensis]|uniref:TadE family type IV pilus minor pilin n=1 Tax=Streptomonospora algeriensis TaxID=995084 RepID=A0ABW3BD43_9ACTN